MQPTQIQPLVIVAGGAIVGAAARYGVQDVAGTGWWVTLFLNVIGSAIVGWMLGRRLEFVDGIWLGGAVGFCGGLTTFSGFALDVAENLYQSHWLSAAGIALSTVVLAIVGAGVGYRAATQ